MALVEGCGSRWLKTFHGIMYDQSLRYRMLAFNARHFPREKSRQEHRQILDLALARDMARLEQVLVGAEIMLRTAGYTAPIRDSWRFTNQANSFQNQMITANVCKCGSDGSFDSMGEGMIVNFDGSILAHGTSGRADEIIPAEVLPDLVREARKHWGVEDNIYQLGHRGFTAVAGGAQDCPYTYMQDLVAGKYRLPWEDKVVHVDGTSCGFARPTRRYGEQFAKAAE